ncbi:MAG: ImmA/IrrE family metallo-endopeptidase [Verrucomicrobia bacterium]|nr:ImmA/IrrE family metallo-endopeptidase [Verrucomicrobiota bacterium]
MNLQTLANNIRRHRNAQRLSQKRLADMAGISVAAIKNIELAKNEPRMKTLQAIAKHLNVKLQELFYPVRRLQKVRFRSKKRMHFRENVLARVARWLDDFNYLEEILNEQLSFTLQPLIEQCNRENVIEAAQLCREKLGLKSTEPIYDICGLLEHTGIKVLPFTMASDSFFGLSVAGEDGGPAVIINVWDRISVERQIFSAAHELAHLILHREAFNIDQTNEDKKEEKEADLFAGHFLMPQKGFQMEWNEAAGLDLVDRVFKVKRIYRVSYKTVLHRLLEHEVVDDSIWKKFNRLYLRRYNRKLPFKEEPMAINSIEPEGMKRIDFQEDRFNRLTRDALEKDMISLSRGAEILNCTIIDMKELLDNWEAVI